MIINCVIGYYKLSNSIRKIICRKNVCIEREESTSDEGSEGDKSKSEDGKNKTETTTESNNREPNFFATSIRLSNCFETENKYECVTR